MLNDLLSFWLLPSLVTFLLVVRSYKRDMDKSIEDYTSHDWPLIIAATVIYPFGLVAMFCIDVWPWLIKER